MIAKVRIDPADNGDTLPFFHGDRENDCLIGAIAEVIVTLLSLASLKVAFHLFQGFERRYILLSVYHIVLVKKKKVFKTWNLFRDDFSIGGVKKVEIFFLQWLDRGRMV